MTNARSIVVCGLGCGLGAALLSFVAGCSGPGGAPGPTPPTGGAQLALTVTPANVRCLEMTATGTATSRELFDVTPSQPATLTMTGILPGLVTFSGQTFPKSCALLTAAVPANWVTLPVKATIVAGATTAVELVMQPAGNAKIAVGFKAAMTPRPIGSGASHTCGLTESQVVCWGTNSSGQLGTGDNAPRGDAPGSMATAKPVDFGPATDPLGVSSGDNHNCATVAKTLASIFTTAVACWGSNESGQLGTGDNRARGSQPGDLGPNAPTVDSGGGRTFVDVVSGAAHNCALSSDGKVACWGSNSSGQLGGPVKPSGAGAPPGPTGGSGAGLQALEQAETLAAPLPPDEARGDEPGEMGDSMPDVDLGIGRTATAIAAGRAHTCALLDDSSVKCWGDNSSGQLGLGDMANRGRADADMGDTLPAVDLGDDVAVDIAAGGDTTCVLTEKGDTKCWGDNGDGQLGVGDAIKRGNKPGDMGALLKKADVGTGRKVAAMKVGKKHVCALLDNQQTKCWGANDNGELGLGDKVKRGDKPGDMGDKLPPLDLGKRPPKGPPHPGHGGHTCIELEKLPGETKDGTLFATCWGKNDKGQLGHEDTKNTGDDPDEMGDKLPPVALPKKPPANGTTNRPNGAICAQNGECASGFCVEGVCCNSGCGGLCQSCAVAGAPGTCTPVPNGIKDPALRCTPEPAATCGRDGVCDGAGACRLHRKGTVCGATVCAGNDSLAPAQNCDGMGACIASGATTSCLPYTCNAAAGACGIACTSTSQCTAGFVCLNAVCRNAPACNPDSPFGPLTQVAALPESDGIALSLDELTAYVSVRLGTIGGYDIYTATRPTTADAFTLAGPTPNVNSAADDRGPWLSENGQHLYFTSTLPTAIDGTSDIVMSSRPTPLAPFGAPQPVESINSPASVEMDVSLTSAERVLYFSSGVLGATTDPFRDAALDIFFATKGSNGLFGAPQLLNVVNAQNSGDSHPVISRDGLTIYFKARRLSPLGDTDGDIWVARRANTSVDFGQPEDITNLGTTGIDFPVALSADECTLYFGSNRDTGLAGIEVFRLYQATRSP